MQRTIDSPTNGFNYSGFRNMQKALFSGENDDRLLTEGRAQQSGSNKDNGGTNHGGEDWFEREFRELRRGSILSCYNMIDNEEPPQEQEPRRSVSFHNQVDILEIPHWSEWSGRDRLNAWYTELDQKAIQNEIMLCLEQVSAQEWCPRGLEHHTLLGMRVQRQNVKRALCSVLEEQERQRYRMDRGSNDDEPLVADQEPIALACMAVTAMPRKAAHNRGLSDAEIAELLADMDQPRRDHMEMLKPEDLQRGQHEDDLNNSSGSLSATFDIFNITNNNDKNGSKIEEWNVFSASSVGARDDSPPPCVYDSSTSASPHSVAVSFEEECATPINEDNNNNNEGGASSILGHCGGTVLCGRSREDRQIPNDRIQLLFPRRLQGELQDDATEGSLGSLTQESLDVGPPLSPSSSHKGKNLSLNQLKKIRANKRRMKRSLK